MKIFCFLISFAFLNVSADDLYEKYTKNVYFTNLAIERAHNTIDLTGGDNSVANGLEHVIEKMVNDKDDYEYFGKINNMISVPEKVDIVIKVPDFEHLTKMRKSMFYQTKMQTEIRDTLKIDLTRDNENQIGRLNLTTLANERRVLTRAALKNIITRKMSGRLVDADSLLQMCRLIGLYTSTKFPTSYIEDVQTDPNLGTCVLCDGSVHKIYKTFYGVWWQVKPSDHDDPLQSLEQQLM